MTVSPDGATSARLEAFSDGVLSIAATLLVLELHVPDRGQDLGPALLAQRPSYAAYVVRFATIGIIWVNHHQLFVHVRRVDRTLLFLNLVLLMVVSLIPFPTAILGRFALVEPESHLAAAIFGGLMILMSLAFTALWRHVTAAELAALRARRGLLRPSLATRGTTGRRPASRRIATAGVTPDMTATRSRRRRDRSHIAPVTTREELIYLLSRASELEHGLACIYLFAAFSLKNDVSEGGMTPAQAEMVRRWKRHLSAVAVEEMLHLARVPNLLTAIGGAPHFKRANLPMPPNRRQSMPGCATASSPRRAAQHRTPPRAGLP